MRIFTDPDVPKGRVYMINPQYVLHGECGTGRNPHTLREEDWEQGKGRCTNCGQWIECHDR